jgi:cob(I)alamin adenosyltransferase
MTQGHIHIYTGNGKGKTTAAIGLAVRAAGAGQKVHFIQFLKGRFSSEERALRHIPGISIKKFGSAHFIKGLATPGDRRHVDSAIHHARFAVVSGRYQVVVLDEICAAIELGLVSLESVKDLCMAKPAQLELVLTGRNAPRQLVRLAGLVTEMRAKKHYFSRGIPARIGIEK